jgi:electron transfer flavoprotein beta subunit
MASDSISITRDIDGGSKEMITVKGPVVVSANKGLNNPRYASLPGIMKAKKKVLKEIVATSADCGFKSESKISELKLPAEKSAAQILAGEVPVQVKELVRLLRDESKVL